MKIESKEDVSAHDLILAKMRSSFPYIVGFLIGFFIIFVFILADSTDNVSKILATKITVATERSEKALSQVQSLEAMLKNVNDDKVRLENRLSKNDVAMSELRIFQADELNHLVNQLSTDSNFKSKLLESVEKSPSKGFLRISVFNEENEKNQKSLSENSRLISKLLPIYEAIDVNDKERVLAIPLIRQDIESLRTNIKELKSTIESNDLQTKTILLQETSRIYDFGKWFIGLLVIGMVIPLVQAYISKEYRDPTSKDGEIEADDKDNKTNSVIN